MKRSGFVRWLGVILVASACSAHAVPFTHVYILGDSLSDQGNDYVVTGGRIPPPEYSAGDTVGRFTNGQNYVDHLARRTGLTIRPAALGGTNYAYGGARTDYRAPTSPFALSLLEQRDAFLRDRPGGALDPAALYVVWGGSNDLGDVLVRLGADPGYDPTADLAAVAANIANVVTSLAAAGARDVLVPNIPDLGLVPGVTGGGPAHGAASALVGRFNAGLDRLLYRVDASFDALELDVVDVYGLVREIYEAGAGFGFSNVREPCYSRYVEPGGTECDQPDQYLFWDLEHPTSAAHRVFAARLLAELPAPPAWLLLIAVLPAWWWQRRRSS